MPPTPLCLLARKYGSDKYSAKHSYTAYYYEQFKDRRDSVRKVVEIGVGEGASLRMWREFFPNAMIYGADKDTMRVFTAERVRVVRCDQSNHYDLLGLAQVTGPDVDLCIDDGSHDPTDQISTCLTLMPLLSKDVTYVIEDVPNAALARQLATYQLDWPILEYRRRYDNRLAVVKHPCPQPA